MLAKPGVSTTASAPAEVLSRPLNSPLAEVYKTEEFKDAWDNDVRFHVARNLLHLRRYRSMTQSAAGKIMGTSQSAIARIETGQENITLDTLQRHTAALNGRFYVSIRPREFQSQPIVPWWEQLNFDARRQFSALHTGTGSMIFGTFLLNQQTTPERYVLPVPITTRINNKIDLGG